MKFLCLGLLAVLSVASQILACGICGVKVLARDVPGSLEPASSVPGRLWSVRKIPELQLLAGQLPTIERLVVDVRDDQSPVRHLLVFG